MGIDIIEGRDFTANDEQKENASLIFNRTAQLRDGITVGDRIWGDEIVGIAAISTLCPCSTRSIRSHSWYAENRTHSSP